MFCLKKSGISTVSHDYHVYFDVELGAEADFKNVYTFSMIEITFF